MTIKNKLIALFFIITLGLAAIAITALNAISSSNGNQQALSHLKQLNIQMLELRRSEKDFLMRRDIKYSEKFSEKLSTATHQVSELKKHASTQLLDLAKINQLSNDIDSYADSFQALVDAQLRLGLDHKSGLEGKLRKSVHKAEQIIGSDPLLKADMLMLRRHEKDFMLRGQLKYVEKHRSAIDHFMNRLSTTNRSINEKSDIENAMLNYQRAFISYVETKQVLGLTPSIGLRGNMRESAHKTEVIFDSLSTEIKENLLSLSDRLTFQFYLLISIFSIAALAAVGLIAKSILKPIDNFCQTLSSAATNKDVSIRFLHRGNDEFSKLADSFNLFFTDLEKTLKEVKSASASVTSTSDVISAIGKDVGDASQEQSGRSAQAAVAINQMASTIQHIAENAEITASTVATTNDRVKDSASAGGEALSAMVQLNNDIQEAVKAITALETNSESIGQVLDSILGIAEQTNLLALNAAIEAARAGDQGRGFAVVADEVRTLAQRTQESTESIRETISQLQLGIKNVINTIMNSSDRAEKGIHQVTHSSEILQEITEQVAQIKDMTVQIAAAAEQQNTVSEEINRNIHDVSELSQTVHSKAENSADASQDLAKLSIGLQSMVSAFHTG